MHVAIVGAGALGRIYGVKLANAGCDVSFVVRPNRVGERAPFAIEVVGSWRGAEIAAEPHRVARVPPSADVVLLAVRFEQLEDRALLDALGESDGARPPIVVLTPMFPPQHARLTLELGPRVVAAMPGALGYVDGRGIVRAWIPPLPPTFIDDPLDAVTASDATTRRVRHALDALVEALERAEVPARFERGILRTNAATTIAFFPLIAAIGRASNLGTLAEDRALLARMRAAMIECAAIADRIGPVAPWARALGVVARPIPFRVAVGLARAVAPEPVRFLDGHFGAKLTAQHRAMASAIVELADSLGQSTQALKRLTAA